MAIVNATSFLLAKETTVLGHSTSTVINFNQDLIDITNKDSQGWQEFLSGVRNGSIKSEGLSSYSDALNFDELEAMLITREQADFYFKNPANETLIIRGRGFISSVTETAESETVSTYEVEITLTGVYAITDATEALTWDTIFTQWELLNKDWENV